MDKSSKHLYTPFYLDRKIVRWLPCQPNKALRWRLTSQIWRRLCEYTFDQSIMPGKDPEFDPIPIVMRDIAGEELNSGWSRSRLRELLRKVILKGEIEHVVRAAMALCRVLQCDSPNDSFYDSKGQSYGEPLLRTHNS